jgi:hypothetical protein
VVADPQAHVDPGRRLLDVAFDAEAESRPLAHVVGAPRRGDQDERGVDEQQGPPPVPGPITRPPVEDPDGAQGAEERDQGAETDELDARDPSVLEPVVVGEVDEREDAEREAQRQEDADTARSGAARPA